MARSAANRARKSGSESTQQAGNSRSSVNEG
jgi:hypothetical protein